ncbi:MAG: FAD/NAD(P)-binding protein [Candidatus Omnitrophota bacterium]|nr:FAD/NAD(P)-binding protein [Candidatus Omnitrophota bacterium]
MIDNPYLPIKTEVLDVIEESPTIKTFSLKPEVSLNFKAGQFIEMSIPGKGEAPFTPSSSPHEKDKLEVTIMKAGRITAMIHDLKKGDTVGLRGPYGKEYPLSEYEGKEILLVGGGVGLAPLRALFLALVHDIEKYKSVLFCCGSRTPSDIIYKDCVLDKWQNLDNKKIEVRVTVDRKDDSWKGKVGLVTTTLDKLEINLKNSVSIVCGPPIMMKFATFKLLEVGYKPEQIYLSMEKNMSCGIGKCGHCRLGNFYACKDGPVFRYDKISHIHEIWD